MKEPTIDEAIRFLKEKPHMWWKDIANDCRDLTIKALEEMKVQKNYCNFCELSPAFPGKINLHRGGEQPRTWRDVTAGELSDHCNPKYGLEIQTNIEFIAKHFLKYGNHKPKPLSDPHGF